MTSFTRLTKFTKRAFLTLLFAAALVPLSAQTTYTFTNAGATGNQGPSQTQVNNQYTSTSLDGKVTVVGSGIQQWIVPHSGIYKITAAGARGGDATNGPTPGNGASMQGDFNLTAGDTIWILVGQMGQDRLYSGGGGGGTFVTRAPHNTNNSILIIAGGGGASSADFAGLDGTTASCGTFDNQSGPAACNGDGGVSFTGNSGGGGGGFFTNGQDGGIGKGGKSYISGGLGGTTNSQQAGGFGGGGGQDGTGTYAASGGGGYSGGSGGNRAPGRMGGGGGGSWNAGTNQINTTGTNNGHGIVTITSLRGTAFNDAGIIGIDSPNVYCAGTHNVVATIQNYGISRIDSVTVNWSVNGTNQTPVKYIGTLDTMGGSGSFTAQVTLGSYTFNSSAYNLAAWTSLPNGVADTAITNDTFKTVKQANLPPPTGLTKGVINATNATLHWTAGSISNTWAYVNSTSNVTPTGPGTVVSTDSAYITGLSPTTTYYFFVREICHSGDSSTWAGPIEYRTPCANILNGTYTINPAQPASGTNFTAISDAVYALLECGISGPVVFHIASGTFTERVLLEEIPGASALNSVTFIGAGIGSTIITNAGSSTANWSTVLLDGTDHVHFRDMTIRGTSLANSIGIHLINKADSNSFSNIHVQMNNASTATTTAGVALSTATSTSGASDAGNYNTFDSLNVTGAYSGFEAFGTSTTGAHSFGNKLLNSTFTDQNSYGIRFYYQNDLIIDNNSVTGFRSSTNYGIYLYYCSDYQVTSNYVISNYEALRLSYCDRSLMSGNNNSLTANNMLQGGAYYTLYCYYSYDVQFYHNTVINDGGYANNAYFYYNNNLDARNNIFINKNTGATSNTIYITSGNQDYLDYNVYHSLGATLLYHGATYNNFTSYRTAFPLLDEHSLNIDPQLSADMHLTGSSPEMPGSYLNIDVDIDGDIRCDLQSAIGADEPAHVMINPLAEFAMPDTLFINSPARFINTSTAIFSEPLGYAWYMDGVEISTDKNIIYTFNATGTYDVMLKTRNCGGYDSFSVSVQVVTPQSVPESDFTASQLVANTLPTPDIIQLYDMSLHGATAWSWVITPSLGVTFDPNAANPSVQFTDPGYYDVCLTAENMNGVGTTHCKTAYIYVNDEQWMGGPSSSSNMPGGRISDDGWVVANYGANAYASFLIHPNPCSGELNLKFSLFDLADNGDVLSVYDGEDQNGLLLGNFTVGDFPGGNAGLTAYSGKMFLLWTTNGSGEAKGWEANWSTVTDTGTALPVADFTAGNTIYTGTEAVFTATADKVSYRWDFAPPALTPGVNGGKAKTDKYTWNAQGVYDVKLEVKNCAGTDSITKQITVVDPTSTPVVGFYADQLRVPAHTTVNFFDTSDQGPTGWWWSVTPSGTASFETAKTVKNPSITFYAPGNYEIKLVAENSLGKDSLTKTAYIQVFDYCVPAVGTLNADMGISRVQFAGIDNSSSIGQAGHTKYIKSFAAQKLYQRAQYSITIERNTANDSMSRKAWIDFNGDGDFTDAGERIAFEAADKTLSYTANFTIPVGSFTGLSVLRVGTSYAQGNNSSCGINPMGEFEDYPIEIAIDDILPLITRIGADTVYTEQWYQYTDAGATALDELDGDITSQIMLTGTVDSSIVGTYILSYNVSDFATNMAETVTRTVIVTPDVTAPVITLIGTNPVIHTIGTPYNDAGAIAVDYFNRDITPSLLNGNNVDVNTLGTYYFWYTVTDANGNTDSVARVVEIVDNIAPVLTMLGDTLIMEVFGDITDPGFVVTDNHYTGVNVLIDSSSVNKNVTGLYMMLYTATDSSGNVSTVTRPVKVLDTQLPVITMANDEIDIEVHTSYVDPGVVRTDNYCVTQAVQSVSTIDTAVLGEYTVTYTVTDCEGNASLPVIRTVNVVDRTAPVVALVGNETVSVLRWTEYTDEGITVIDNYYSISQLTIDTIGTWVNSSVEDAYYLQYRVTDPSGNIGFSEKRYIDVRGTNSIANINGEGVRVYPNPSTGKVTLEFNSTNQADVVYTISDMAGKLVSNGKLEQGLSHYTLDLSAQSTGVYRLMLSDGSAHQVIKLTLIR